MDSSLFRSFIAHRKKEILKYSVLQGKAVNELGRLKKFLIVVTQMWIYYGTLRGLCKSSIYVSTNACDADVLVLIHHMKIKKP